MKQSKEPKLNWYYFQRIISNNSFTGYEILSDCYEVGFTPQLALLSFFRKEKLEGNSNYTNIKISESFQGNIILASLEYGHVGNEEKYRWDRII